MKQKLINHIRRRLAIASILALVVSTFAPFLVLDTHAATLNQTMVRIDRHLASTIVTWTVCFMPTTASASASVQITFPDTFTVSTTLTDYTTSQSTNLVGTSSQITGLSANATAASNTNGSKGVTFTYTSATLSNSTRYCFIADSNATAGLTTPASAANNVTGSIVLSNADSGSWGTSIVNGSSNYDQWTVGAVVPQLFTYTGPGTNTDNFASNLDPTATQTTSGKTVNIKTNAPNGYYVWAKDLNTGIKSTARTYTIASTTPGSNVASCPVGTESYTSLVTASVGTAGGTGTPSSPAAYSTNCGSGLNTTYALIGSSAGTSNGDNYLVQEKANISNGTPAAGDYSDTVTVVAAGVF